VVFRYAPELPAVLDGVSIEVRRGEFVAIVGRTGCGKSTLLRLMLGLEVPESGTVLYDGTPMENLDPTVVRSQLGVVMQSTSMLPGNIQTTILGIGSQRTIDDAWAAAELVGMTDEIDAMPMGMSTMVGPGSLSGAQSQRLLIARALVGKPEVLFLDEATSALDNTTQRQIAESIEGLAGTRVAIAHRLSTIREADRIYVLQEGKVVQCGTYDDLVAVDGHFTDLMAGQLV
jgi:ABC-type bacteriocin/lantibiotic exporter with double-glycine peptidase domain